MRVLLIGFVLTLAAMAGCLGGDGDPEPTPTPTETEAPTTTPAPAAEPEPELEPENSPPTASLSASIEQGEIPVNVTFTLDGADADGDALTWTLDLGDGNTTNGTELPFTYEHSYNMEGLFTVTFTVSDGNDTGAQTLIINATAAPLGVLQEASLAWAPGNGGCGAPYLAWVFGLPPAGVLYGELELVKGAAGAPYTVTVAGVVTDLGFIGYDFYDADGVMVAPGGFASASQFTASGIIPKGADYILFNDCATEGGGSATITINVNATAVVPTGFDTIVFTDTISGLWVPGAGYSEDPHNHTFALTGIPSKMTVVLQWGDDAIDLDLWVVAADGSEAGSAAKFNYPGVGNGGTNETVEVKGPVLGQIGEWRVEVYAAAAVRAEYTVTITFDP